MNKNLPTFIDTNMLIYLAATEKINPFLWLDQLYEQIYVHVDVLNELTKNAKNIVQQVTELKWTVFDPSSEQCLTDEQFIMYEAYFDQVRADFKNYQNTRTHKKTQDVADISIITSCLTLGVNLITSNDSDFQEILPKQQYKIASGIEEEPDKLLEVHGLLQLGRLLIENEICSRKDYFKFLSAADIKEKQRQNIKHTLTEEFVTQQE